MMMNIRRVGFALGFALALFAQSAFAQDPLEGTWIGSGGQYNNQQHTIALAGGALEVRPIAGYTLPSYPSCTLSAGQLLGRFTFAGTADGKRRYTGTWITWVTSSTGSTTTCTFGSVADKVTATLEDGQDGFQQPALPFGPNNIIAVYLGEYPPGTGLPFSANWGFNRKSGSVTSTPSTPSNDNFQNAVTLPGASGTVSGSNAGATQETGEPSSSGNSVWWKWTPSSSGLVTFDTIGSAFDTYLSVYTGSAISALSLVAQDDDGGGAPASRVTFSALAGTAYSIAVTGFGGASGNIRLNWQTTGPTTGGTGGTTFTVTKVLPQVAVGSFDGNLTRYSTVIEIVNTGSTAVDVGASFYEKSGAASSLTFTTNLTSTPAITGGVLPAVTLAANSVFVITGSTGTAGINWAKIQATGPVTIATFFEIRNAVTNVLYSRVGVNASHPNMTRFVIPRIRNVAAGSDVAFAVVNTGTTNVTYTATLKAANGATVATKAGQILAAGNQTAQFANEFFGLTSEPAGTNYGYIVFEGGSPQFAAIAIAFEGIIQSSFPVDQLQ